MNVNLTNLNQFLASNNVEFVIPTYQRNYAWQKKHCEQLLEDVLAVSKEASKYHFLGTITYILHNNTQQFGNEYVIIDGQQRITSLMLLLKALHQLTKDENIKQSIEGYLNFNRTADKSKLRLKPIEKDREALECVMNKDYREFNGDSNIIDNYRFFLIECRKALHGGGGNLS